MSKPSKPSSVKKASKPAAKDKAPPKPAAPEKKSPAHARPAAGKSAPTGKAAARASLRSKLLGHKTSKPIAFSLDEVRAIAKTNTGKPGAARPAKSAAPAAAKPAEVSLKGAKPAHIKAASLADILGFNPRKPAAKPALLAERDVPEKFRRFHRLLLDLRNHVLESLGQHTEETLKRSAKEDAGDLSGYGQHMADAGTDTFDRDFALSLVSNEQEALSEIDAAIKRIHDGTYGICELTGKPIAKERLLAVPFARNSAEAQKELEKNQFRSVQRGGIFGDAAGEDGGKMAEEDSGDE